MTALDYLRQSRARERAPHLSEAIALLKIRFSVTVNSRKAQEIWDLIQALEGLLFAFDGYRDLTPEYAATLTEVE